MKDRLSELQAKHGADASPSKSFMRKRQRQLAEMEAQRASAKLDDFSSKVRRKLVISKNRKLKQPTWQDPMSSQTDSRLAQIKRKVSRPGSAFTYAAYIPGPRVFSQVSFGGAKHKNRYKNPRETINKQSVNLRLSALLPSSADGGVGDSTILN